MEGPTIHMVTDAFCLSRVELRIWLVYTIVDEDVFFVSI